MRENPFRDQAMAMGIEVCGEGTEGLNRDDRARPYISAVEELLKAFKDALKSGLREKGKQGVQQPPEARSRGWSAHGFRSCCWVDACRERRSSSSLSFG